LLCFVGSKAQICWYVHCSFVGTRKHQKKHKNAMPWCRFNACLKAILHKTCGDCGAALLQLIVTRALSEQKVFQEKSSSAFLRWHKGKSSLIFRDVQ